MNKDETSFATKSWMTANSTLHLLKSKAFQFLHSTTSEFEEEISPLCEWLCCSRPKQTLGYPPALPTRQEDLGIPVTLRALPNLSKDPHCTLRNAHL
jgi:hypothetical protein